MYYIVIDLKYCNSNNFSIRDYCDSREIAFCKRLKMRRVDGVLLLQGSKMKEGEVGKEVGEGYIFVVGIGFSKILLKEKGLKWCEVQLSYAIGVARPMAIYVDSDKGNLVVDDSYYEECEPRNIIKDLNMLNLDYEEKAKFGHFVD